MLEQTGGVVVDTEVLGFISTIQARTFQCSLPVLSKYSGFLPQSKDVVSGLPDYSKLPIGANDCLYWLFNRLVMCPGCAAPLTLSQLGLALAPPATLN